MMNGMMPPMGGGMGGGQNPQAQEFLMKILQALFGGSLGQGGGMPGGGMPPPSMGGGGMGGGTMAPPLPRVGVDDPTMKMPSATPPGGRSPYGDFDRDLPRRTY